MGKRKVGALEKVEADLGNLQYKIRRDPLSYREDFIKQLRQYEAARDIFLESPASSSAEGSDSFRGFIDLIAHVADCYPDLTGRFPDEVASVLTLHHAVLEAELREKIVGSLVLLRRKEIINSSVLLNVLFPILTSTPSKTLRALLFRKILSDLRLSNQKTTNHQLNRTIQTVLFNLLTSDRTSSKGIWAVKLTRELWKRQMWTGAKAAEIMKEASLAENEKVIVGGVRFFLGADKEREELEDESSDEETVDIGKLKHQIGINKKSKKQTKRLVKAVTTVKKRSKKESQPHPLNFSALHLLHDPQSFAEELFQRHLQAGKTKLNLEQKLQVLQLVSRLVGLHKLTIINLYSYFLKYLTPKQASVTSFLASLAQATHNLVPPDVLEPLVQKIANEFISEAVATEVAAAGLNTIREICTRQPMAMSDTLLQDLVLFRKSKDKGVEMAAKGLLGLYREVGADLLRKRDRGRAGAISLRSGEMKERRFGEEAAEGIEGLELLEQWKVDERRRRRAEKGLPEDGTDDEEDDDGAEEDWGGWEVESEDSDDSVGWINVESDDEINISDDEGQPVVKKLKQDAALLATNGDSTTSEAGGSTTATKPSTLATTRILTPADLIKLQELKLAADINYKMTGSRKPKALTTHHPDDPLTAERISKLGSLSSQAAGKEAKSALGKNGKPEREDHRSNQSRKQKEKQALGKSSTNSEKARKKNFMMTLSKARGKQKRSLRQHQKILRGHLDRAKRGGKRGNIGQ